MIFRETTLKGAFVIEPEPVNDDRGFFVRTWSQQEFSAQGLNATWVVHGTAFNHHKGTLRGMHYQVAPHEEVKLVRCTRGAIYDVIVDLRSTSPTYCHHVGEVLSLENRRMLYIPKSFVHGYLTLEDNSEVCYQMSEIYVPASASGFRWDDPSFRIEWPKPIRVILDRDRTWPLFLKTSTT